MSLWARLGVTAAEREELTPTARACREYLAHCHGAAPGEYVATEAQAWARLCRLVPALGIAQYTIPDAPPSNLPALPPAADA